MVAIVSRSAAICSRRPSSSTSSARRRRRVSGVRRSCETAARARARSSTSRRMRACMSLKALAARCVSVGPVSGSGGASRSRPSLSAASAKFFSGWVAWRTAIMTTAVTTTSVINNCTINALESAGIAAASLASAIRTHWPSIRRTSKLRIWPPCCAMAPKAPFAVLPKPTPVRPFMPPLIASPMPAAPLARISRWLPSRATTAV